mgnify:FL=1|jgi:hypothetical protein
MIGYSDTFVDDTVHVEVEVVDLGETLLANHMLYHWIAFG